MITALFLGIIKTAISGIWDVITTLLSGVFSGYTDAMTAIVSAPAMQTTAGIVDIICGWEWLLTYMGLVFLVLPIIRLAKFIIGIVTKG